MQEELAPTTVAFSLNSHSLPQSCWKGPQSQDRHKMPPPSPGFLDSQADKKDNAAHRANGWPRSHSAQGEIVRDGEVQE